jgi:hypothetical protein
MSLDEHPALVPANLIAHTAKPIEPIYAVIHQIESFDDDNYEKPLSYSETILPVLNIGIIDRNRALQEGFDCRDYYTECAFFVADHRLGCASWIRKYKTYRNKKGVFRYIDDHAPTNIFFTNERELCDKFGHISIPRYSQDGGAACFDCVNQWKELGCAQVSEASVADVFA